MRWTASTWLHWPSMSAHRLWVMASTAQTSSRAGSGEACSPRRAWRDLKASTSGLFVPSSCSRFCTACCLASWYSSRTSPWRTRQWVSLPTSSSILSPKTELTNSASCLMSWLGSCSIYPTCHTSQWSVSYTSTPCSSSGISIWYQPISSFQISERCRPLARSKQLWVANRPFWMRIWDMLQSFKLETRYATTMSSSLIKASRGVNKMLILITQHLKITTLRRSWMMTYMAMLLSTCLTKWIVWEDSTTRLLL